MTIKVGKKIIIAAGGTGGHLFPAQALAVQLRKQMPDCTILFMGKGLKENPRFDRDLFSFLDVSSSTVTACPKVLARACLQIPIGIWQSVVAMRRFAADMVIGFGSFHSFPVLCAASLLRVPMVLHVADCVPGRVNRLFSKKALLTAVFFPEAKQALKGTVCQSSIPLRAAFCESLRPSRLLALQRYGLSEDKKTILVFGGSQGAKNLNQLVCASSPACCKKNSLQFLHFTGSRSSSVDLQAEYDRLNVSAIVRDFESEMQYAWAAADLVIGRAGASTIAEQMAFAVPGILIPYPYATDQHQDKNAKYFEEVVKGGRRLQEKDLKPETLATEIEKILEERIEMAHCIKKAQEQMESYHFSGQIVRLLQEA